MGRFNLFVLSILSVAFISEATSGDRITLETLLDEMVNRDAIAQYPDPAHICRQFSSYDRDTVGPDKPGWFANWDRSQFVRKEENDGRTEWVMLDAEGPGAIVRFWGTWHGPGGGEFSNGTMRIYLDNKPEPVIQGPIADIISGGKYVGPPLSNSVSPKTNYNRRGHNLYFPIPYAKHCKITYETKVPIDRGGKQGEALYYQINYRTYSKDANVESLSDKVLKRAAVVLEKTQKMLADCERGIKSPSVSAMNGRIFPGKSMDISLEGASAITQLSANVDAEDIEQALRSTVLSIEFDGEETVWCPIGDFFGTGHRIHPYKSWYTQATEDGNLTCYWTMPFQKGAKIKIINLGEQDITLKSCKALYKPWKWDDRSMYFHANWRQYYKLATGSQKGMDGNTAFDVNYVEITGKGTYAGDTLTIFNGATSWWGEGDEKIFIDGEYLPSHIGTGTEDYYGYAWCRPEFFESPFHAQPQGGGNLQGGLSVNSRYRLLDGICFTKSLKFDMEMWHWARTKVNYAPATFWYGLPGTTSNIKPDPEQARMPVARKIEDVFPAKKIKGAIEGENMKILDVTGGQTEIQNIASFEWSNNRQLWWRHSRPGDSLKLSFDVEKAGGYNVTAALTTAIDYGILTLKINGKTVLSEHDFYHTEVVTKEINLGKCELKAGANILEVTVNGANEKAVKAYMFGLDYLLIKN